MNADGRARTVEALLDYFMRRDAKLAAEFEARFGIPFDVYLELLGNEPIWEVHWKQ